MDNSTLIALQCGVILGLIGALWLVIAILRAIGGGGGHLHL